MYLQYIAVAVIGMITFRRLKDVITEEVRTESVGKAVSAAGLLALVLTMTKAGTDGLPLAFLQQLQRCS